jgi:energy-coupling factor transporter ATP-binding protein EcfA2
VKGDLDRRLGALASAVELAEGRLDEEPLEAARAVVRRAGERLGLGLEETVVALAGPTGAGKSTLFNVLAGVELAAVGRRRPTTSTTSAAQWGDAGDALLDWLDVRRRHRVDGAGPNGLVLLDLPDFDSVETTHRLEVDRLVDLVDLIVWVVDPQKYADSAWHDRYLRPLARHGGSMLVALDQADLLTPAELAACRADLERLLAADGLDGVPVLPVSGTRGDGLAELRAALERRLRAREAALARLGADVTTAAAALDGGCGREAPGVRREDRERLRAALAAAAGVPVVARAVAAAHRRRGALATGWPFVRWLRRLRPDPLRRLRLLDRPQEAVRTSLAAPSTVQRAQVATASRKLAEGAAGELPQPWPGLVRSAAVAREDELADRLDRAVAGAELPVRRPLWWRAAGALQVLLAGVVLAGLLWLLALILVGFLQLDDVVPVPDAGPLPAPTALLLGGALAGVLLGFVAGRVNAFAAGRRARATERTLSRRVDEVGNELVVEPVERELQVRTRLCESLRTAAGR